jgi:hypothetical protein
MDLPTFIRTLGIDESADLFDVSPHTAKAWLYGERVPRPSKATVIVERTANHPVGQVTLAGCYPPTEARAQ